MIPHVVVFDLDETLASSKMPMTPQMAALLARLLSVTKVSIASGGKLELLQSQVVEQLPKEAKKENLYLQPTSASALYTYTDGTWSIVYKEEIPETAAERIRIAIEEAMEETGLIDLSIPSYGERIEYRGSQVTLSALGQKAPIDEKVAWDPERIKRPIIAAAIAKRIPEFDVRTGGATSFDITQPGINKAFGIRRLSEYLSIPIDDMLYVGDALFPGGNDEVVKETGIATRMTSGPEQTGEIIQELLS